jgi:dUTP pyrophosphatase
MYWMQRTERRYYKVGEEVWVIANNTLAEIKDLNIKPDQQIYEAVVEYKVDDVLITKVVNLWEIDKNKRTLFKNKRKAARLTNVRKPTILFAKVNPDAIIPSKDDENAGYDIYACFDGDNFSFPAHATRLVPTGVASSLTDDWALVARERGSTGVKGMGLRAGVIDSGYRGEIFIAITNENDKTLVITKTPDIYDAEKVVVYPASKAIAQLILTAVPKANVKEISYDKLKEIPSKRGEGKLGDSGK